MTMVVTNTYPVAMKIRALRREIAMRQRVYAIRVANSKMSQAEAEFEIDIMQAILKDYEQGPPP